MASIITYAIEVLFIVYDYYAKKCFESVFRSDIRCTTGVDR